MKVGVDGVLVALWAHLPDSGHIIDVGTGCGVISLICAQRAPECLVEGIDIDLPSVEEASGNFLNSPWRHRLKVTQLSLYDMVESVEKVGRRYELIISNPPFFDSGVAEKKSRRMVARHQGALSPLSLLEASPYLLKPGGSLAIIVPSEISEGLELNAKRVGLVLERLTFVRGHDHAPFKRALMQFKYEPTSEKELCERSLLTLELAPGVPTEEYRLMGQDFYLRF